MRRSFVWLSLLPLALFGCNGGEGDGDGDGDADGGALPDTVELNGEEIRTRNWGIYLEHLVYDMDQNQEPDYAEGVSQLIGTNLDDPCGFIQRSGAPPEGESAEWVRIRVEIADLPLEGWPEGETFSADGTDSFVRFEAFRTEGDSTLFEAGGPADIGTITNEGQDEFGPRVTIEAPLGYVRVGVANTQVDPPEMLTFDVGGPDVVICEGPPSE